MHDEREFGAELDRFLCRIDEIRAAYDRHGPGRVPPELAPGLSDQAETLVRACPADHAAELAPAIRDAAELANRCATRSEGLCFITGEAGLIRRRDLHERFDAALQAIRRHLETDD